MEFKREETVCFTGHRPHKLKSYEARGNIKMLNELKDRIVYLIELGYKNFITGMAIGIDMWAARIVLNLKKTYSDVKLICAIPCEKQWAAWVNKSPESVEQWHSIVSKADLVHYVSDEPYTAWCMQVRDKWMVDKSSVVQAVWDGSDGGTGTTVKYARKKDVEIYSLNPNNLKHSKITKEEK